MSQVNTHTYGGSQRTQLQAAVAAKNKRMWMSEYGDGDGSGMTMASQILNDVRNIKPTAWVYWQTVDNATGWGFVLNGLDGSANYNYTYNEKYYVMANFSRFIRPGYQMIGMSDSYSLAAYDGLGTVAIVTLNSGSPTQTITYSLQNFGAGPWTVTPHQTSSSQNLATLSSFNVDWKFVHPDGSRAVGYDVCADEWEEQSAGLGQDVPDQEREQWVVAGGSWVFQLGWDADGPVGE